MRAGNFPYAVLGLIAGKPEGAHGYQLMSEVQALSDDFWQLDYGALYRILDSLEARGSLAMTEALQSGRPNRKVYRVTPAGQALLEEWLLQPIPETPRPLRDELSLKLLFLRSGRIDHIAKLVTQQRGIYTARLGKLTKRRRRLQKAGLPADAVTLVIDGAEQRLRADLSWLDHVERYVLHRF